LLSPSYLLGRAYELSRTIDLWQFNVVFISLSVVGVVGHVVSPYFLTFSILGDIPLEVNRFLKEKILAAVIR